MKYETIHPGRGPLLNVGNRNSIITRLYIEKFTASILIAWNVMKCYGGQSLKNQNPLKHSIPKFPITIDHKPEAIAFDNQNFPSHVVNRRCFSILLG